MPEPTERAIPAKSRPSAWRRRLLALALGLLVAAIVVEIGAQGFYHLYLQGVLWRGSKTHEQHFFQRSESPVLGYEMRPNWDKMSEGRWLRINEHGIRARDSEVPDHVWKVALLGDSVVFGNQITQERTLAEMLQQRLDPTQANTRVLNFGVSGYGFEEIMEFLRRKDAIYDVDFIVFVLNPNDFCRRGTVTEGSDGGLYRMYQAPTLMTAWLVRKGVYRLMRGTRSLPTDRWHRWIFRRNGGVWRREIAWLASYAGEHAKGLLVAPFPAGSAYHDGDYALADVNDAILAFLGAEGIASMDLVPAMGERPGELFDGTNHCTDAGNALLADLLAERLREARRRALEERMGGS